MERCGSLGCDAAAQASSQRPVRAQFLNKTYQLVDDPATDDIVSWGDDRVSTFVVWRPREFARDILPKIFKHNNLSSFVRQLNTYGFRKIVPDRWEFAHEFFRKGEKQMLCEIQRRKRPTSTATPAPTLQNLFPPPHHYPIFLPGETHHQHQFDAALVADGGVGLAFPPHPHWREPSHAAATMSARRLLDGGAPPAPSPYPLPAADAAASAGGGVTAGRAAAAAVLMEENERLRRSNKALLQELTHMRRSYKDIIYFVQNHSRPVAPSPSDAAFLQGIGLQETEGCENRQAAWPPVSPAWLKQYGGSSKPISSLTIAEEPSPPQRQQQQACKSGGGEAGSKVTTRSPSMLFGVHISAPPARKPGLAQEAGADLSLTVAVASAASSPASTS